MIDLPPDNRFRNDPEPSIARIRQIVRRFSSDQNELDELSQECCVRILEKERLWKPARGPFLHWLSRVARNTAINHARDGRRKSLRERPLDASELAAPESEAVEPISTDLIRRVLEQFQHLPPAQKEIFRLRYFEGLAPAEIGERLGISPRTVSNQLSRGLQMLRSRTRPHLLPAWIASLFSFGWARDSQAMQTLQTGAIMSAKKAAAAGLVATLILSGVSWTYHAKNRELDQEVSSLRKADETSRQQLAALTRQRDEARQEISALRQAAAQTPNMPEPSPGDDPRIAQLSMENVELKRTLAQAISAAKELAQSVKSVPPEAVARRWKFGSRESIDPLDMAEHLHLDPHRARSFAQAHEEISQRLLELETRHAKISLEGDKTTIVIPPFPKEGKVLMESWREKLSRLLTEEETGLYQKFRMDRTAFGGDGLGGPGEIQYLAEIQRLENGNFSVSTMSLGPTGGSNTYKYPAISEEALRKGFGHLLPK